MTTDRFEPDEGAPYGRCKNCDVAPFADREELHEHLSETFDEAAGRSHQASVINPTREERVRHEIGSIIDQAITDAIDSILLLAIRDDATYEEITEQIRGYDAFVDAWQEAVEDNA